MPLPEARDLEELNAYLERCCHQDHHRVLDGRTESVGTAMLHEQPHLLPLVGEPFDLTEISYPTVDRLRCVRVRTNRYSIPLPPGTTVEARLHADFVELWHEGRCVARHERCYSQQQQILDLEHYLDALRKKPGALAGSTPLAQWRQAGRWPECFDRLWQALNTRLGKHDGTRQMIELLSLGTSEGWEPGPISFHRWARVNFHKWAKTRFFRAFGDTPATADYRRKLPLINQELRLAGALHWKSPCRSALAQGAITKIAEEPKTSCQTQHVT